MVDGGGEVSSHEMQLTFVHTSYLAERKQAGLELPAPHVHITGKTESQTVELRRCLLHANCLSSA
jgi:hypothetical protein